MNEAQSQKVISYLEKILASIKNKSMLWNEANPTTYVYRDTKSSGKIIVQKLSGSLRTSETGLGFESNYMLQATADNTNQQFSINSNDGQKFHALLKQTYQEIESMKTQEGIDLLGSMLE